MYARVEVTPADLPTTTVSSPAMYTGFSTAAASTGFRLYDLDLIKQDILNNFSIRRGSKLMNPEYGTIIWDLIFDPFTPEIRTQIAEDVNRVLRSEPRISVSNVILDAQVDQHSITLSFDLQMRGTNMVSSMALIFNPDTMKVTTL